MSKIKIKLAPGAEPPKRATANAGGWDIKAHRIEKVSDGFYIVHTGLYMEPEKNFKITLVPRSSLTNTQWVMQNTPGLGDADFRGEYQLRFRAFPVAIQNFWLAYPAFPYQEGDRVGQMYLEEVIPIEFEQVIELELTERGAGGYGSTGA